MLENSTLKRIFGCSLLTMCGFIQTAAFTSKSFRCRATKISASPVISAHPTFQRRIKPRQFTVSMDLSSQAHNQYSELRPLNGKTALITGSSGGIGAAIAKKFAEAGADVIIHYNSRRDGAISIFQEINDRYESSHDDTPLGKCLGIIQADFRDSCAVEDMFRTVTNDVLKESRLDILVNNAGIVTKLAVEDDDDDLSVWLAHTHMKSKSPGQKSNSEKRKGGVIINNTSIHGTRSVEFMAAYAASKAALDSLTRSLACEYAPDGVRVNAIAPGVVPVERTAEVFADPKVTEMWTPHLPIGRLGAVDDIAHATLVLATNEWTTGTVLTVDGGMMARASMPFRPRPPKPEPSDVIPDSNGNGARADSGATHASFEVP